MQPNLFGTHRAPSTVLAAARALRQPREVGTNVTCVSKTRKPRAQEVKRLTQDDATGKRNPKRLVLQPSRLTTTLGCLRPNTEPQKRSVSTPATLSQKIPVQNSSRRQSKECDQGRHEGNADGPHRPGERSTSSVPKGAHCTQRDTPFRLSIWWRGEIKGEPVAPHN